MDVAVVGSLNRDITVRVARHPALGETVLGQSHVTGTGGKGANQAMAAARLGAAVAMVGRVGDDEAGRALRAALEHEAVDAHHIAVDPDAGTGLALITLDDAAENAIVVSPGANGSVDAGDVEAAGDLIVSAAVVLVQLEVPVGAVLTAAGMARGHVVLNPAPAQRLPDALLERVTVLVPNRTELATLAGATEAATTDEAADQARSLGLPAAIAVTLGADGALFVTPGEIGHVPAPPVAAVDTTGAGDAFCGALAAMLAGGAALDEAVRWAVHAGALATTRIGAQAALPTRDDVAEALRSTS
ncbi:MAG: ribokinase [Acidimicrobiia bacterium]